MLYSEFIEGTGCRQNDHNYEIYRRLELMYMADDSITKQEIYEYGKKLVDNSKTEQEIEFENRIKADIEWKKQEINEYKNKIKMYKEWENADGKDPFTTREIKWCKEQIKDLRRELAGLKFVLA